MTVYTSLVIEGGGSKNIAALGALYFLKNQGYLDYITNYAGTSSGAIICTLLNMGFDPKEIFNVVFDGQVNKTIRNNFFRWGYNLFKKYGVNNPRKVNKLITNLFVSKGFSKNVTFKELFNKTHKNLVLTGTNISRQKIMYFHHHSTPDTRVIDAIRISMNIPLYFTKLKHNGDYYVDGFLLMNFPLHYFDEQNGWLCNDSTEIPSRLGSTTPNNKTLGIMTLDPDESLDDSNLKINGISSYISAILNTMLNNIQHHHHTPSEIKERSIVIKLPFKVDPTDFQPSENTQTALLQVGFDTAQEYLSKIEK